MPNRVTAYLLPQEKRALEQYCSAHSVSKSQVLREALQKHGSIKFDPNLVYVYLTEEQLKKALEP